MSKYIVTEETRRNVTRPRKPPTVEEVYQEMVPNRCYVAADLREAFGEYEPSHNTIRNRLAELVDENRIERRDHTNGYVTFRRPD